MCSSGFRSQEGNPYCWESLQSAHLSPVSKAVDSQSEIAARSVVGLDELPVAVKDCSAVLILVHAGMAPAKVRSKAIVHSVPRLYAAEAQSRQWLGASS